MADRTKPDLGQWYHTTLFVPVNQTLVQSINKFCFATWSKLTIDLINKHLSPLIATAKDHLHQTSNNLNYKNPQEPRIQEEPSMTPLAQRTNTVFTKIIYHKRQISTDLTGKFPATSNRGNTYIFLLYEYNINIIMVRPMKASTDINYIRVFKDLNYHLITRLINPAYMRL